CMIGEISSELSQLSQIEEMPIAQLLPTMLAIQESQNDNSSQDTSNSTYTLVHMEIEVTTSEEKRQKLNDTLIETPSKTWGNKSQQLFSKKQTITFSPDNPYLAAQHQESSHPIHDNMETMSNGTIVDEEHAIF
ncbi:16366_t:CDS:2, partial [Gigaspora margarita]